MRRWWLLLLPCLFLPDFGTMTRTDVGTGELTDFLIAPYILLTYLGGKPGGLGEWRRHRRVLLAFAAWALLSTLTINLRYGYARYDYILFSLIKVGKLFAYGLAGVLTARALERDRVSRLAFSWLMLVVCMVLFASLIQLRDYGAPHGAARVGFASGNGISVALATMYCWMVAYALSPLASRAWCMAAGLSAPLLLVGLFFSDGRGGWVAALLGGAYIAVRSGIRPLLVAAALIGGLTMVATYETESGFRKQVDITLNPQKLNYQSEFAASTGFDDGSRIEIWEHEAPKLLNAPIFGSGLHHRGGYSTLWVTGSHSFWLQMFLETGVVGGVMVLMALGRIWKVAGSRWPEAAGVGIPVRAALVAAFVGGMTGEYYYGGKALLILFLVAAPALSLPFESRRQSVAGASLIRKPAFGSA